ncbi:unnamed protein product [Didymodactylos carnosus]|uniref:Uncharacterized protein n=1 Tax=Didymodactylos carnosus TaxID=1234261 RepID=A0A8S2EK77_9BILA|nr:unnamed protein product [Didymodactylos carnosus]CAF3977916.1 unnamed protein product [Didymodactylos carnosus]
MQCAQPYFPPQITFSVDDGRTLFAIDEINERAFKTIYVNPPQREYSFVMKNFPYAIPDSPESKYYVQLSSYQNSSSHVLSCLYGTYWKYGGNVFNSFPSHWWYNTSSFEISNYLKFKYDMIHSESSNTDDYWYSNETCRCDDGKQYPCQEIYFKKNTDIPIKTVEVVRQGWNVVQRTTTYDIISIGKLDDQLFEIIPKNWAYMCRDVMLGLLFYPQTSTMAINKSSTVEIWLITPPHFINANDTVTIEWKSNESSQYPCNDCVTWMD